MRQGRRPLNYDNLDQVMPDVERLLEGHGTVGNWSLAQICRHLATITRVMVDLPASTSFDPALLIGEERKRAVIESGIFPDGVPTGAPFEPPAGLDDREEAEMLRQAISYYAVSLGPAIAHPLFGPLTRAEWDRIQCIHCAHHLSFAVPTSDRR